MKKLLVLLLVLALCLPCLASCDIGAQGPQGLQGIQGEKGDQGEPGEKGDKGDQGEPGEKGDKGDQGESGSTGKGIESVVKTSSDGLVDTYTITFTDGTTSTFTVENGDKGDQGEPGEKGDKGETGAQGPKGDQGEPGEKGDKGDKGDQGEPGEKGDKGDQGEPGEKGDKGDQGDPGEKGDKGDTGEAGKDGVGIDKVEIINGELIITYTDGTVTNAGALASNEGTFGLEYYPLPDGTYAVSAGTTKYLEEIVIPKEYNGKAVTVILDNAFQDSANLKKITIPDSVTSIGSSAFSSCSSLTSIVIGDSVTSIGPYAFEYCRSLTSIVIPDSVTSIGEWAFYGCTSLTEVHISNIEAWCNINFEDFVSNPLFWATNLYLNGELVTELVIPDSVTSIGDYAFFGYLNLESITIPESVTKVGEYALANCRTIHYAGTVAQAKEVFSSCFSDTQLCLVVCSDGSYYANGDDIVDPPIELIGTYDITIWVSEKDGVAEQFQQQIDAFEAKYPGIIINASIKRVTEADAGSKVVADVATAPDIYCFAQDQLARLVQAGALAAPGTEVAESIKANNDVGSVKAASVAGTLYAYPMTSDIGYYMYYDTSIISPEDADSMEAIIAACEANGVKFRFALENAWYTASFFFATGCTSTWQMNENGEFIGITDDFNSDKGIIAMKGMQKLAQSSCYDSNADIFTDAGVVITGIWNATAAEEHFGANLGATDLPSFTVDGETYHLGSYTGNKLMGVKPQTDAKRAAVLSLLAQYLTGERCQQQRYESFEWGPSNKEVQASEAVQSNISLAALAKQGEYGQPQGQIHGSWWDIAKVLGAEAKNAKSDADLQKALDNYDKAIDAALNMSEEVKNAWTVIGGICGTSWDADFPMTEGPDGTYTSEVLELHAGEEFKVRQGASWDVNFGVEFNGANIVVEADGKYQIVLVWYGGENGTVTLVPIE